MKKKFDAIKMTRAIRNELHKLRREDPQAYYKELEECEREMAKRYKLAQRVA